MLNGPLKVILIRAGRYDYAEVELAGSVQMVGPNNTGKTTLINTLQFLYVDDLRTMDFGSYSLEQTLAYYFPNQYSYVLFECLGGRGKCVVGWRGQSKASGGDLERFCYLGEYDPADFLAADQQVREPRDVTGRLSIKQFRQIRSAQEHREMLLPPEGGDDKGLGIVSLRDNNRFRRFRESLKDLLSLSSITQEQMRDRLLTLADVRTDVAALDVRKLFGEDYDLIKRRRDALARFKKHEPQVRQLVERSAELDGVRNELVARWTDLRQRRQDYEQSHRARLDELQATVAKEDEAIQLLNDELVDRNRERDTGISECGALQGKLSELDRLARSFEGFEPELARAAEQNAKNEELRLKNLLAQAHTESQEKVRQKIAQFTDLVKHKEQLIDNFDHLVVTELRKHFTEDELNRAFGILSFDLLELPLGADGVDIKDKEAALSFVRQISERIDTGRYRDSAVEILLRPGRRSLSELADVPVLKERLEEDRKTLTHWEGTLQAILERERLAEELKRQQTLLADVQRQLVLFDSYQQERAEEPKLRRDLQVLEARVKAVRAAIAGLEEKREAARGRRREAQQQHEQAEKAYNELMVRFDQCVFPSFSALPVKLSELPADLNQAITIYLKLQEKERRLHDEITNSLRLVAGLVGEEFTGADDVETIKNLHNELEALPVKSEALERDWNALIQGLRGLFAGVLKELDAVKLAAVDLNRQFGKIQVSNLQAIKLEVLEAGDLVSWIRKLVDIQQPGLFDEDTKLDQTLRNFRQKLEGSPLISYSQLFSLQFTVVGQDGVAHHYQDFRQIESHGTTIAIKVLFNLIVLRRYLREEQCVVPFFLDEIQALDPGNRAAVLSTSRKLGFLAITASPEPITEVESLYFLQPKQGRIILRQKHKVGIKLTPVQA
jgi:hypothetical protein